MIKKIIFLFFILHFFIYPIHAEELIFITNVNVNDFDYPYVKVYNNSVPTSVHLYNYSESFIISSDSTTYIYIKPNEIELLNSQNLYENVFNKYKYIIIFFFLFCVIIGFGLYIIKEISRKWWKWN